MNMYRDDPQDGPGIPLPWATQTPILTYALVAVNVFVWLVMTTAGGSTDEDVLLDFGAMFGPLIADGQYWRLFTAMFLHVGPDAPGLQRPRTADIRPIGRAGIRPLSIHHHLRAGRPGGGCHQLPAELHRHRGRCQWRHLRHPRGPRRFPSLPSGTSWARWDAKTSTPSSF